MAYTTRQKKKSGFTTDTAITNDSTFDFVKSGINKKAKWSDILDKIADVYGLGVRLYEDQSAMVADTDLAIGDHAIVEGNRYALYEISNVAAVTNDVTLSSGLIATYQGRMISADSKSYADLKSFNHALLKDGEIASLAYRASEDDGGGGQFRWDSSDNSASVTADPGQGIYVPPNSDTSGASGCWVRNGAVNGVVHCEWFGAVGDWNGSTGTNNSTAIQNAIDFVRTNRESYWLVKIGVGRFAIESPLKWKQSVSFLGAGTLNGTVGGTEIVCNFSAGTISTPPTDIYVGEEFTLTLDYTPMMYNTELITQQKIGNFQLDGNSLGVYGLYLHEFFYVDGWPITIVNCGQSPLSFVVGQFTYFRLLTLNASSGTIRMLRQDTLIIDCLDTESNNPTGSMLDIVQFTSTKSGVQINAWHYEESASLYPQGQIAQISGRGVKIREASLGMSGSNPLRYIETLGAGATYNFDGVSPTLIASIGTEIGVSFSTGTGGVRFNSGTLGAFLEASSLAQVVDNSGNDTNTIKSMTDAPQFGRGTQVNNSSGGTHLHFPDDSTVAFFTNSNRRVTASGAAMTIDNLAGNLDITSTGRLNLTGNTDVDIDGGGAQSARFDGNATAGNTRMLVWDVDNNTLERVSVGAADSGGSGFKVLRIPN